MKIFKRFLIILGGFISLILIATLITAIITAVTLYNAEIHYGKSSDQALDVSATDLANNPEKYDGKFVRVRGAFSYNLEDVAIYPSQDCFVNRSDFDENSVKIIYADGHSTLSPGIWLNDSGLKSSLGVDLEELMAYSGKYIVIEGTFNPHSNGHFDSYPGTIENISRISIEKGRKIYRFERYGFMNLLLYWLENDFPSPVALWWLMV